MPDCALLLSIRPDHADRIFAGTKTAELRRVRPRLAKGDWVLVYATSPRKELVGRFQVQAVVSRSPSALWREVGALAGVDRDAFADYFSGAKKGYAILIARAVKLHQTFPLETLRERVPGFHPPQGYMYLSPRPYDPRGRISREGPYSALNALDV